ncbi:hypothetical protein CSOJ01_08476 [Colletotrichum sojae]|uniref:Uncharacterized protein n=1 Tax=Colletotrichum sojae TaxID=2175907 RepID=A0A8H6MS00_9PEZI|nr:hypothetical protein CSOJ01_08476 [Colletotrichum sojae]
MSPLVKVSAAFAAFFLATSHFAAAAPNLTADLIPGDCSVYPDYDASTGQAGPWSMQAQDTGNYITGHGLTAIYSRGSAGIRWGYMAVLDKAGVAQNPLRCVKGEGIQGWVPTGVSGYTWENLVAADIPYNAFMMYKVNGTAVQPYSHSINGTKQSGIFLGSEGYTTWGFKKETDDEQGTYWEARVLGANSADPSTGKPLFEGEITGFLRVYGS